MQHEFQRVAIVNRGEAAMRFIHAAREFAQETGTTLRTIALYTEPDRRAMFVREADESVLLGSAHVLDSITQQPKCSVCGGTGRIPESNPQASYDRKPCWKCATQQPGGRE